MKPIFRRIGGRIVPMRINEMTANGLYHSNRTVKNYEKFLQLYKIAKNNLAVKAARFVPGGIKDPVRLFNERLEISANHAKQFKESILNKASKDQFSQHRASKKADKMLGIFSEIDELTGLKGKAPRAYTKKEVAKLSQRPMSKREFFDFLDDKNALHGSFRDDAANIAESEKRGGIGRRGLMDYYAIRKRDAIRYFNEVRAQSPKAEKIDRMVNLRGKGVRLKKVNGEIKLVRSK